MKYPALFFGILLGLVAGGVTVPVWGAQITLDETGFAQRSIQPVPSDTMTGDIILCEVAVAAGLQDCPLIAGSTLVNRSDIVDISRSGATREAMLLSDGAEIDPGNDDFVSVTDPKFPLNSSRIVISELNIELGVEFIEFTPQAGQPGFSQSQFDAGTPNVFDITSDIPEPSTLILLTTCIIGAFGCRARSLLRSPARRVCAPMV